MRNIARLAINSMVILLGLLSCQSKNNSNYEMERTSNFGPGYIAEKIKNDMNSFLSTAKAEIAIMRWENALAGALNAERPIPILDQIETANAALLVIDMQNVFLQPGAAIEVASGRKIIPNINLLANAIRKKGGRIIWFRYLVNDNVGLLRFFEKKSYLGGDRESPLEAMKPGHPQFELHPGLDVDRNDIIMDKIRYSAVLGSDIVDTLQHYGIENVILTGVTTDVCAGNTAEDLMQMDFHIVMVWDGCAALDRLEHELYLARIFGLYGDVMPTEEIIIRLK